jgi:hypothetical protein
MPRADRTPPARDLVDVFEFAAAAGCSAQTVRRWIWNGTLPSYRLASTGNKAGMIRVDLRDLDLVVQRERIT